MGLVNRLEPDTMQFLAAKTTIPIPKIYNVKLDEENDETCIVMEHMPGERLERVWVNLTEDQRVFACCQIAEHLAQLKRLTSQKIESVNGGPVRFGVYDCNWGGPFNTEKEFNDFVVQDYPTSLAEGHAIHFAHGDLSPRNILVDENAKITAIVDWEWAGWYPEYWDVVRMFTNLPMKRKMPGYADTLRSILPWKYEAEYSMIVKLIKLMPPYPVGRPVHQVPRAN